MSKMKDNNIILNVQNTFIISNTFITTIYKFNVHIIIIYNITGIEKRKGRQYYEERNNG